jgi:hypothetical protein
MTRCPTTAPLAALSLVRRRSLVHISTHAGSTCNQEKQTNWRSENISALIDAYYQIDNLDSII